MEQPTQGVFPGFEYANSESGFTQIGNKNFALLAHIDNLSEMKVIIYLMRNTWGYQEYEYGKLITTEEFVNGRKRKDNTRLDSGCGLKTTAVKEGLARGIEHGYILCTVDDSDKGRIKKYYKLKMDEASKPNMDELDSRNATMRSHNATMDSRKATDKESQSDHRSEKETLETHLKKQTKQKEENANASSFHPFWILWCQSRTPEKDGEIAELSVKNLGYCKKLDLICQQQNREISIELIQACEKWACEKYGYEEYWMGNLVRDLPKYLKSQIVTTGTSYQGLPEMPELTEEELDEKVLWTSSPSAARRLFADGATMREHMEDRYCKPRWMSRRDAREYDYDMPEVQHYTLDQQAEYRRLAGRQELAIAG